MRIVFMSGGNRPLALRALIEKGEHVVAVMTPPVTDSNRRFLSVVETALQHGVPVIPVDKDRLVPALKGLSYEIMVSCGFPFMIPQAALDTARYAINVHPTLLPQYRGYRSGPFILINGERRSGVTIHYLTSEMDRGNILAQAQFPVTPFDTPASMYRKTQEIEPGLLVEVVQKLKRGDDKGLPQDESKATTYETVRKPEDSQIDWSQPLKKLYNEIRACDPDRYPAHFLVEGQKVCIRMWRPDQRGDGADTL